MVTLVLRTVYLEPDLDERLRVEAFDTRTSKNDLLLNYLRLGMAAADATRADVPTAPSDQGSDPPATARPADSTPRSGKAPRTSPVRNR